MGDAGAVQPAAISEANAANRGLGIIELPFCFGHQLNRDPCAGNEEVRVHHSPAAWPGISTLAVTVLPPRKVSMFVRLFIILLALITLGAAPKESGILIKNARVFDGTGAPAVVQNVLIEGERITAVGAEAKAKRGIRVIDGKGMTLMPGLHDLHTHLRAPAYGGPDDLPKAWASYILDGVTTVNDFSVSGEMLEPIRSMTAPGGIAAPNLKLAVRIGVPGGHGTEYGWGDAFTLEAATPRAAHVAMKRALPYRPDVIKVFADGWRYGRGLDLNSMNQPTLAAIVEDAHRSGISVITHTVTLEGAKIAASAGVDAIGHGIGDALVDDELIDLMRKSGTAYVPTLVVYEPQSGRPFLPEELDELAPPERAREDRRNTSPPEAIPDYQAKRWSIMQDNVRRLSAAGIPIGVGTDAGIGGVYHGSATQREVRLLAGLGLSPSGALAAGTSVSAKILRSTDHGQIAPGQRADLVLIAGKPDERIEDIYAVRRVIIGGREMPLKSLRATIDNPGFSPLPVRIMAGLIDTGARPDGRTDLDTLPVEATESGVDHSDVISVRPGGADMRKGRFITARLGGAERPAARLIYPLTKGAIQLADASAFSGVVFDARGSGSYRLTLDNYGIGGFGSDFAASDEWLEVRIAFTALTGPDNKALDPKKLRAVTFALSGEPGGDAWLLIANLRFYN